MAGCTANGAGTTLCNAAGGQTLTVRFNRILSAQRLMMLALQISGDYLGIDCALQHVCVSQLTMLLARFSASLTVLVGNKPCTNVLLVTAQTQITCSSPTSSGLNLPVIVSRGAQQGTSAAGATVGYKGLSLFSATVVLNSTLTAPALTPKTLQRITGFPIIQGNIAVVRFLQCARLFLALLVS